MRTRVVHVSKALYDVYIGRGLDPMTGVESKWGNPFRVGQDGNRAECLRKHKEWLLQQPELMEALSELQGKILGCWCKPKLCHGDTLAELADQLGKVTETATKEESIFEEELS